MVHFYAPMVTQSIPYQQSQTTAQQEGLGHQYVSLKPAPRKRCLLVLIGNQSTQKVLTIRDFLTFFQPPEWLYLWQLSYIITISFSRANQYKAWLTSVFIGSIIWTECWNATINMPMLTTKMYYLQISDIQNVSKPAFASSLLEKLLTGLIYIFSFWLGSWFLATREEQQVSRGAQNQHAACPP